MTALTNQMQDKMTIRLNELRQKVIGQMTSTGERIKKRPSLPGDEALQKVSNHDVMKQDDDGFQVLSAAIGLPGLGETAGTMVDVGIDLYADRKATRERPQDRIELSPKQERQIREQNAADLHIFMELDEKLTFLNSAIASGDVVGLAVSNGDTLYTFTEQEAIAQGLSIPKANMQGSPDKYKPSDEFIAYHANMQANRLSGITFSH